MATVLIVCRGECNANADYTSVSYTSDFIGNLSFLSWISSAQSYFCEAAT